jgi:hypothetical protein
MPCCGHSLKHGGFICGPEAVGQTVQVKGATVYFDFDHRFGPLLTDREGEPLKRQPISARDPFWPPFNAWVAEYHKTNPPPDQRPRLSAQFNRDPQP